MGRADDFQEHIGEINGTLGQNITKEELEKVFSQFNGFHEVRLAKDKNRQRIAFVDYDTPQAAEYAMSSTIGYRPAHSNKGISKSYFTTHFSIYLISGF